jgi:hypothetical protein
METVSPGSATRRLTKFLLGSTGHSNTTTSPRRGSRTAGSFTLVSGIVAPKSSLLTSRKSPTSSVLSMLPDGILYASTSTARSTRNSATAAGKTRIHSKNHPNRMRGARRLAARSAAVRSISSEARRSAV